MERINDTRKHFYKNCKNPACPNVIGPFTSRFDETEYCPDCTEQAGAEMKGEGRKEK